MSQNTNEPDGSVASAFQASGNRAADTTGAQERLDRLHNAILTLGLERNIVELELYG